MVLNPLTIKQFISVPKTMIFKDLIQQIAMNNKDLALEMCRAFFKTLNKLSIKAWEVTKHYVENEEYIRNNP